MFIEKKLKSFSTKNIFIKYKKSKTKKAWKKKLKNKILKITKKF